MNTTREDHLRAAGQSDYILRSDGGLPKMKTLKTTLRSMTDTPRENPK